MTPSERKSIFTNFTYNINDNVEAYLKALYNTRDSENQAAPEPIFVGPYAETGGLADNISISALNPYNPFGINLNAASNLGLGHAPPSRSRPACLHAGREHLVFRHRPARRFRRIGQ